ncbi:MAG: hypothetical protein V1810_04260 [Candidatus Beckwithbacteria bacterium]
MKIKLLEKICSFPAVSGNEQGLVFFVKETVKPFCQNVFIDNFGNLICQKGKNPTKLTIFTHIDKIGFVTSKLKPKIEAVGLFKDVEDKLVENKPVGVVIDGIFISYQPNFKIVKDNIFSQGLDNALGVVAAIELLQELKEGTVVFTVQEEMGFHGARAATKLIQPEKVLVIDTTYADDKRSAVRAGEGVSFCVKDNFFADKKMLSTAIKVCQQNQLKYQLEVILEGNSDIQGVFDICGGLPYLFVGIPINKMHSNCESVRIQDFNTTINFLKLYVKK